eukprot:3934894-Rhodomonas_salina.8
MDVTQFEDFVRKCTGWVLSLGSRRPANACLCPAKSKTKPGRISTTRGRNQIRFTSQLLVSSRTLPQ